MIIVEIWQMKHLKSTFSSFILPALAVLMITVGFNKANDEKVCKHQYALCTSAQCIPQPDDPNKAICFCDVEEGESMSTVSCDKLRPSTDENGIRTVYSTFSLKQFESGLQAMKCPEGTPWTWCLNKKCTVDPANPQKAICTCDIIRTGEWMTLGGNCETSTCKTGYWSGAALKDFDTNNAFMTKVLGLNQSPTKWCPTDSP